MSSDKTRELILAKSALKLTRARNNPDLQSPELLEKGLITYYGVHDGGEGTATQRSLLRLMRTPRDTPPFIPVQSFLTVLHLGEKSCERVYMSRAYTLASTRAPRTDRDVGAINGAIVEVRNVTCGAWP